MERSSAPYRDATACCRNALRRDSDSCEKADEEQQADLHPSAGQAAVVKLRRHTEHEVALYRSRTNGPAYNVQTAVDAETGFCPQASRTFRRASLLVRD
jgi:hypothetical protein